MGSQTTALLLLLLCVVMVESSPKEGGFDVVDFGAAGDGEADDSEAFQKAWKEACESTSGGNSNLVVPEGKTFLLKSAVEFQGPCKSSSIRFQVLGNIIAPNWKNSGDGNYWLAFSNVDGLTINGDGVVDGNGPSSWSNCENGDRSGAPKPPVLTLKSCTNFAISGLGIKNAPRTHMSITNSDGGVISNINITTPGDTPNTDGIDISQSTKIQIHDSVIKTGDDCIAIKSGSSFINITSVYCGPGHGISIGSLGEDGSQATVEEVHVKNCTFVGTQNAARIKTWQGGSGYAKKISFQDITLDKSKNPILIDQYYCDGHCITQSDSTVEISDVSFIGFTGTSATKAAVQLLCSESVGCKRLVLDGINIQASSTAHEQEDDVSSKCINAHGTSSDSNVPRVSCLLPDDDN